MLLTKVPSKTKLFKCNDENAKKLYDRLGVLPINTYYCKVVGYNLNVFILTKKLEKFLKDNHIEVAYE